MVSRRLPQFLIWGVGFWVLNEVTRALGIDGWLALPVFMAFGAAVFFVDRP